VPPVPRGGRFRRSFNERDKVDSQGSVTRMFSQSAMESLRSSKTTTTRVVCLPLYLCSMAAPDQDRFRRPAARLWGSSGDVRGGDPQHAFEQEEQDRTPLRELAPEARSSRCDSRSLAR
jgi:hypothetical protein